MSTPEAFIAATRFGLGAKPGELAGISQDPYGWLQAQLSQQYTTSPALANIPSTMETVSHLREQMQEKRKDKQALKQAKAGGDEATAKKFRAAVKEIMTGYRDQSADMVRAAAQSPAPFMERIIQFWTNHFTVSVTKPQDVPLIGAFERDAIRPNVLGDFHTLLRASTRHPAMQVYLDNFRSIGPDSIMGRMRGKGLNENLAREIMELHTLGVNGGYTQSDVTEFAKILTGWTIDAQGRGDGSGFFFARALHEPGTKTLLGETYREDGVNEGERALAAFADHPSTAKFIATKLARHFVADDPPPTAVEQLEAAFRRGGGQLMPVYRTLITLKEAWAEPLPKVKTPSDYIISILRATGLGGQIQDQQLMGAFRMLGQAPFSAPSPAGWSDMGKDWIGAEALLQRIDLARTVARRIYTMLDPAQLLEDTIGPVASSDTKFAVTRAGSAAEAVALLFASPEFQRR